jgi:FkbM family methyltransferase
LQRHHLGILVIVMAAVAVYPVLPRAYRALRYGFDILGFIRLSTLPAFRLAQTLTEHASIGLYIGRFVIGRMLALAGRKSRGAFLAACSDWLADNNAFSVLGTTYYVDLKAGEMFSFQEIYQDKTYEQHPDFVTRAGWVVLDIGANVGVFAVQQARRRARVYAFEPNPKCLSRLRKTVAANRLTGQIQVLDFALGASPSFGTLLAADDVTCLGAVLPDEEPSADPQRDIRIECLDNVAATLAIEHIDLMKIDTEGAELAVLRGSVDTLHRVDRIVLEYHSRSLLESAVSLLEAQNFIKVLQIGSDEETQRGILYVRRL